VGGINVNNHCQTRQAHLKPTETDHLEGKKRRRKKEEEREGKRERERKLELEENRDTLQGC